MSFGAGVLVVCMVLVSRAVVAQNQDVINFPESFADDRQRPAGKNEVPLYAPGQCPENEYFYPGDQPGVYICDCRPSYIFLPTDEKCYAAHEQGPCSRGDILILPENKVIPVCVPNVCYNEGKVMFTPPPNSMDKLKAGCVPLNKPCSKNTMRVFGVNATTLKVECLNPPAIGNRFLPDSGEEVKSPVTLAPPPRVVTEKVKRPSSVSLVGSQKKTGNIQRLTQPKLTERKPLVPVTEVKHLTECNPGCKRSQRGECQHP